MNLSVSVFLRVKNQSLKITLALIMLVFKEQ